MTKTLTFIPAAERPDLLSEVVAAAAASIPNIQVAEIDPAYMNGQSLAEQYGLDPSLGVNCIVVRGKRGEEKITGALLALVGYRVDLKDVVPNTLGVKKVSMALLEEVLAETGMEYGSITPLGLPAHYQILIDSRILEKEKVIVGSGKQVGKLLVPTAILKNLSNAKVVDGLAKAAE